MASEFMTYEVVSAGSLSVLSLAAGVAAPGMSVCRTEYCSLLLLVVALQVVTGDMQARPNCLGHSLGHVEDVGGKPDSLGECV